LPSQSPHASKIKRSRPAALQMPQKQRNCPQSLLTTETFIVL
jgi:hypothetical protein